MTAPSLEAPVTSLTLSPSTVGKSPAAVFVIDQEMIRRSGAQTLPDALRMVPGVHVGIGNVGEPNVSIRGLGTGNIFFPYSSRILVLIDGRSIYDPVVGGVIWSANDVVLQDIERIEVIRGPGATIWGANAVNGVINIITKSAADTQGTLLQAAGGTEYKTITTARVGTQTSDNSHMRIFGKYRDFDDGSSTPDRPAPMTDSTISAAVFAGITTTRTVTNSRSRETCSMRRVGRTVMFPACPISWRSSQRTNGLAATHSPHGRTPSRMTPSSA